MAHGPHVSKEFLAVITAPHLSEAANHTMADPNAFFLMVGNMQSRSGNAASNTEAGLVFQILWAWSQKGKHTKSSKWFHRITTNKKNCECSGHTPVKRELNVCVSESAPAL